jgi:response regulator RpfG family c-di-GMP phosphodiesterase
MSASNPQILFVDDEPNMLEMFGRMIERETDGWRGHYCASAEEAMTAVAASEFDAIVSDIRMPGKDGFELLAALRSSERAQRIPVIILTGDCDNRLKQKALELGATDLLNKPVNRDEFFARVRSALKLKFYEDQQSEQIGILDQMVRERTRELEAAHQEVVWRLAKACEYRDDETGNHVVRVACYSRLLAQGLGMDQDFVDLVFLVSPLHDIGKIGIPDSILLKEGKLTPQERTVIERHTVIGREMLSGNPKAVAACGLTDIAHLFQAGGPSRNPIIGMASLVAQGHHERWDGRGYPQGLAGEAIPLAARIVALADVYDALLSKRPYKPAFSQEKSEGIIQEESGHQFDPAVVTAFFEHVDAMRAVKDQFPEPSRG